MPRCRFAVGCLKDDKLVGVGIAGRPIIRRVNDGRTLEILRVRTDGTANACSFLYARVVRVARLFGHPTSRPTRWSRRAGHRRGRSGRGSSAGVSLTSVPWRRGRGAASVCARR